MCERETMWERGETVRRRKKLSKREEEIDYKERSAWERGEIV